MSDYSTTRVPLWLGVWQERKGTEPAITHGTVPLPARFEVDVPGKKLRVRLVLDRVKVSKDRSELRFVSVAYESTDKTASVTEAPRIPLDALLGPAIRLAGAVGIWYPPNYAGPIHADRQMSTPLGAWQVVPDGTENGAWFVGWADSDPLDSREIEGLAHVRRAPRINSDSDERLRLVAKAYNEAPQGQKRARVLEALHRAEEHPAPLTTETAKRLIAKAKKLGFIESSSEGGNNE
jgi:hypothetical protein